MDNSSGIDSSSMYSNPPRVIFQYHHSRQAMGLYLREYGSQETNNVPELVENFDPVGSTDDDDVPELIYNPNCLTTDDDDDDVPELVDVFDSTGFTNTDNDDDVPELVDFTDQKDSANTNDGSQICANNSGIKISHPSSDTSSK